MSTSAPRRPLLRSLAALAATSIAVLLASCGGSNNNVNSVASIGDSLSDLGAYKWGPVEAAGGGRFTTNPGSIWVEKVADYYGTTISRNRTAGVGNPSPTVYGGLGYGQGGARVSQLPGVGDAITANAMPCRDQVTAHLSAVGGRVPSDQLVFVLCGANDVFYQLGVFNASVNGGMPLQTAQANAITAVTTAGTELAAEVKRLVAAGGSKIVVLNVPDSGATPFGTSAGAPAQALITAMTDALNNALKAGLTGTAGVQLLDLNTFNKGVYANPSAYGFSNKTLPACNTSSSLICAPSNLVAAGADQSYMFADGVHPTTRGHSVFADYVIGAIAASIPK